MKKTIILLIVLISIFFVVPTHLYAESYDAEINDSSVRVRSGAGTDTTILYTLSTGTPITVLSKTLYTGTGCSKGWYKVNYKDKEGYVCAKYITFVDNSYNGMNTATYAARVNANNVYARSGASTSKSVQDTLSLGVNVTILSTVTATNSGCSTNNWYKVSYYTNKTGYICSKYVTKFDDITATDEEYAQTLRQAGFPDSYIPYLTHLHNKYPNWEFVAKKTNSTTTNLYDVVTFTAEGYNGTNGIFDKLIQMDERVADDYIDLYNDTTKTSQIYDYEDENGNVVTWWDSIKNLLKEEA